MLTFTLPQPPTTNALFLNVRGKGRVKTQRYKDWITDAGWLAKSAAIVDGERITFSGKVHVEYEVSGSQKFDEGNLEKPLSDLLVRVGIIKDDRLIDKIIIARREDKERTVTVTIKEAA
jgi:Holliday junction resolvase RusA-like endonuclease